MKLCRHQNYKTIDWILECKYSTDEVLINTQAISPNIEHYLIRFMQCSKYPDWFYMSRDKIMRSKRQKNGRGEVYCVSMASREAFEPVKDCIHTL